MNGIVLIGPRGTGKSSAGKEISSLLGIEYVDADSVFVFKEKCSIADFVKKESWEEFRKTEASILREIMVSYDQERIVLSPGGGAVAHPTQNNMCVEDNLRVLRRVGKLVYLLPYQDLQRSAQILSDRINGDQSSTSSRPSINGASNNPADMLEMLKSRDLLYRAAADEIFYTGEMTPYQFARMLTSS